MSDITYISKVLVVGEEKAGSYTIGRSLQSMGYNCKCIALGVAGTPDLTDRDNVDLVILDIELNGKDVLELIKKMASHNPCPDVILISKYMYGYTYAEIIEAGASDFIGKPFQISELKVKIERINRERNLQAKSLEYKTALKVLLARTKKQKQELTGNILMNLEALILPCLEKLEATRLNEIQRIYVEVLKSGLMEISSPFCAKLSQKHLDLSPIEVQVANLIKAGRENKEIAEILGVSVNTIMTHRYHLRTKLGVKGKKVNLRSHIKHINI